MQKNHLGEREYSTYAAWRRACLKVDPGARFDGDKDICGALHAAGSSGIGEWYGDTGVIYLADDSAYMPAGF